MIGVPNTQPTRVAITWEPGGAEAGWSSKAGGKVRKRGKRVGMRCSVRMAMVVAGRPCHAGGRGARPLVFVAGGALGCRVARHSEQVSPKRPAGLRRPGRVMPLDVGPSLLLSILDDRHLLRVGEHSDDASSLARIDVNEESLGVNKGTD